MHVQSVFAYMITGTYPLNDSAICKLIYAILTGNLAKCSEQNSSMHKLIASFNDVKHLNSVKY